MGHEYIGGKDRQERPRKNEAPQSSRGACKIAPVREEGN